LWLRIAFTAETTPCPARAMMPTGPGMKLAAWRSRGPTRLTACPTLLTAPPMAWPMREKKPRCSFRFAGFAGEAMSAGGCAAMLVLGARAVSTGLDRTVPASGRPRSNPLSRVASKRTGAPTGCERTSCGFGCTGGGGGGSAIR